MKKWLTKMELRPGDLLVIRPSLTADVVDVQMFAAAVASVLDSDLGPVIILPQTSDLQVLTQDELAKIGLVRVVPTPSPGAIYVNWEAYEDEAHQTVRRAFAFARARLEPGNDPD